MTAKKHTLILAVMISASIFSGCNGANDDNNRKVSGTDSSQTTSDVLPNTADMTTAVTTAPDTDTSAAHTTEYSKQNNKNAYLEKDGMYNNSVDTELFWNSIEKDNSGFLVPIERYSTNWELYRIADDLIMKALDYQQTLIKMDPDIAEGDDVFTYDDGMKFRSVREDELFGCKTMRELYDYYCTIYADYDGEDDYEKFCQQNQIFRDIDGKLYYMVGSFGIGNLDAWKQCKIVIYDETETSATVLMGATDYIKQGDDSAYCCYAQITIIKVDGEWRLPQRLALE